MLRYVTEALGRWGRAAGTGSEKAGPDSEQPLRAELFSIDQLQQHALGLAGWHQIDRSRGPDRLLARLHANAEVLGQAHALISAAAAKGWHIAPAAEWLLDNYSLVEEQIRIPRRHLPRGYSRELPRLITGPQ